MNTLALFHYFFIQEQHNWNESEKEVAKILSNFIMNKFVHVIM